MKNIDRLHVCDGQETLRKNGVMLWIDHTPAGQPLQADRRRMQEGSFPLRFRHRL